MSILTMTTAHLLSGYSSMNHALLQHFYIHLAIEQVSVLICLLLKKSAMRFPFIVHAKADLMNIHYIAHMESYSTK